MDRRGFLKVASTAVAGAVAARYSDLIYIPEQKRWVTDMGDFYQLVVPAGKTFSNETFDKPVSVILGERARLVRCEFFNFLNIYSPDMGVVDDILVKNTSQFVGTRKGIVKIYNSDRLLFKNSTVIDESENSKLSCIESVLCTNSRTNFSNIPD